MGCRPVSIKPTRWVNAEGLCLSIALLSGQRPSVISLCHLQPLSAGGTHGAHVPPSSVEAVTPALSRGTGKSVSSESCEAV